MIVSMEFLTPTGEKGRIIYTTNTKELIPPEDLNSKKELRKKGFHPLPGWQKNKDGYLIMLKNASVIIEIGGDRANIAKVVREMYGSISLEVVETLVHDIKNGRVIISKDDTSVSLEVV